MKAIRSGDHSIVSCGTGTAILIAALASSGASLRILVFAAHLRFLELLSKG